MNIKKLFLIILLTFSFGKNAKAADMNNKLKAASFFADMAVGALSMYDLQTSSDRADMMLYKFVPRMAFLAVLSSSIPLDKYFPKSLKGKIAAKLLLCYLSYKLTQQIIFKFMLNSRERRNITRTINGIRLPVAAAVVPLLAAAPAPAGAGHVYPGVPYHLGVGGPLAPAADEA